MPDEADGPAVEGASAVLSVGHSNHDYETFLGLLRGAGITAIADVRSVPRSRAYPHFDGPELKRRLAADGVAYAYLGRELGGRPADPHLYREGVADYAMMRSLPSFRSGMERLRQGASRYRIAMMCSEGDPTECHRCLLVGRALHEEGTPVSHIMPDGRAVTHASAEQYLLALTGQLKEDLFHTPEERLSLAYGIRARKVAHASGE